MARPFPFKLGADPEFTVLLGTKKADACSVMHALLKNDYKQDREDMGYNITDKVNIGWDGCSSTGEIRPAASSKPKEIVDSMRDAFKAVTEKVGIFDFITHSRKAPVGGHVHLDIDDNLSQQKTDLMHRCMSSFYLPIMLCDDISNLNIRSTGSYGQMSDYRIESPNDTITTYEFRVPSAEWLTTPKIAEATLAYMGVVWNEIKKDPSKFAKKYSEIVWRTKEQGNAMQKLLLSDYQSPLAKIVKGVKAAIKTFEFYPDYKEQIDYLFRPKSVLQDKQRIGFNIVKGWGLETKCPTKRDIVSAKLSGKKSTKLDFDAFAPSISLPYNDDTNVQVFATELKKRIISLGWKLKNQYFLFGLRNGVEDFIAFDKASQIVYDGGQIKTKGDASAISDLISRMSSRFQFDVTVRDAKDRAKAAPTYIMVGIPYSMRLENKTKKFIELIYNIEQGKYKAKTLDYDNMPAEVEQRTGTISSIYNPNPVEESKAPVAIRVESDYDANVREAEIGNALSPDADEVDKVVECPLCSVQHLSSDILCPHCGAVNFDGHNQ